MSNALKLVLHYNKAVLYARVSSKEQEQEGFSIPAQPKLLKEYAAKRAIAEGLKELYPYPFEFQKEHADQIDQDLGGMPLLERLQQVERDISHRTFFEEKWQRQGRTIDRLFYRKILK